tara:strand:- start:1633 stop:2001 length:369 start_codon:yes stop_codon:yes gene_type:complete
MRDYILAFVKKGIPVVYSMSATRSDCYINEVKNELIEINYEGKVIFDLLLSNGMVKNRFSKIDFKNNDFDLNSVLVFKPSEEQLQSHNNFYRNYQSVVDQSFILSKPQKFLLRKGRDLEHKY